MARQRRMEFEGAFYHVMARGDRREPIVQTDTDRRDFLETMGRACTRAGWRMHAWVLMTNHYHWLVETPRANLVDGMRWFQNTYTRRYNVRNGLWGHVFGDRYKAVVVDPQDTGGDYFMALVDYIHLNPVRAGMVDPAAAMGLLAYRWSSLPLGYAVAASKRAGPMEVSVAMGLMQCADTVAGRRGFVKRLEERARAEGMEAGVCAPEAQTLQSTLRRGWYWGSETLKEKLLAMGAGGNAQKLNRDYRLSRRVRDHSAAEAEQLAAKALEAAGLSREDLSKLPGSDARKVEIAAMLRERTLVNQAWIAARLCMGSAGNVSQQIYRRTKNRERRAQPRGKL